MAVHRETIAGKRLVAQYGKGKRGRAAMDAAAADLERRISANVPVRDGVLRDSVTVKAVVKTDNPRFEVTTVKHGLYVERGTKNMRAQRPIRNTAEGERRAYEQAGRSAVNKE